MQQQLNIHSFYSSNVMLRVPLWVLVMNEIENAVIINISILCFTLLFMSIAFMNGQISHHSELSPPFIKDCIVFAEVSKNEALKLLCLVFGEMEQLLLLPHADASGSRLSVKNRPTQNGLIERTCGFSWPVRSSGTCSYPILSLSLFATIRLHLSSLSDMLVRWISDLM